MAYYGRSTPNQMRSVMSYPVAGLDEYNPSNSINDNNLSDSLDSINYRNHALLMENATTTPTKKITSGTFKDTVIPIEAIAFNGTMDEDNISQNGYAVLSCGYLTSNWYIATALDKYNTLPAYEIAGLGMPVTNSMYGKFLSFMNWTSVDTTTPVIVYKVSCSFTATAQNGKINKVLPLKAGQKYYISCNYKAAANVYFGLEAPIAGLISEDDLSVPGSDGRVSFTFTAPDTGNYNMYVKDKNPSAWNTVTVYYFNLINITAGIESDADKKTYYDTQSYIEYNPSIYVYYDYSSAILNLQNKEYICFTCSAVKRMFFLEHKSDNTITAGYVDLPFYPKRIVSHLSRIFCIDTGNSLWGCAAGDLFSWYSNEYDDNALVSSTNMIVGAYGSITQPVTPRPITCTVTQAGNADTMGTITIVGTNVLDVSQTEIITPVVGQRVQTLKTFKTITSITGADWIISADSQNDTVEFGTAPSGGYVVDDEVHWPIETEKSLSDLCVLSNQLYIFSPNNIYVLSGNSPDTFVLTTVIVNLGINENYLFPQKWLTTSNNVAYFYNSGDIYQFDGNSYPKLISHPEYINGNNTNGIYGGIANVSTDFNVIADKDYLYVYNPTWCMSVYGMVYTDRPAYNIVKYYRFDIEGRTWSKLSGFNYPLDPDKPANFKVMYVPNTNKNGMVAFTGSVYDLGEFQMYYELGSKGTLYPYIISKAFNTNPSELLTPTSIVLEVKGAILSTATINLYYSTTVSGNDFTLFKTYTSRAFSGDIELLDIPLPPNLIPNNHHYRLKLEVNGTMYLYNIERRFRIRGRSR